MGSRRIEVEIIGDSRGFGRAAAEAESKTSKLGNALKKLGKASLLGGFAALAGTLKVGFDELSDSQAVIADTAAVLKSTGAVARVSAKDVDKLSTEISRYSGIDDEVIAGGQNLLLTFTNVRNEVGKGNDIFRQATIAATDMSVRMGTDLNSSIMQVGKALNSPIKGMAQLGRAGVQFTDDQKALVKSLVESGDVMGAQKVILAELTTQFGGAAKAAGGTLTGKINRAKNAFSEMAGTIVEMMLPGIERLSVAVQDASVWVGDNLPAAWSRFKAVVSTLGDLAAPFIALVGWVVQSETALGVLAGVVAGVAVGMAAYKATVFAVAAAQKAMAAATFAAQVTQIAARFGVATAATLAFGSALKMSKAAMLGTGIGVVIGAVTLLATVFGRGKSAAEKQGEAFDSVRESADKLAGSLDRVRQAVDDISLSKVQARQDSLALRDAEAAYNAEVARSGKGSVESRARMDELTQARIRAKRSSEGAAEASGKAGSALLTEIQATLKARDDAAKLAAEIRNTDHWQRQLNGASYLGSSAYKQNAARLVELAATQSEATGNIKKFQAEARAAAAALADDASPEAQRLRAELLAIGNVDPKDLPKVVESIRTGTFRGNQTAQRGAKNIRGSLDKVDTTANMSTWLSSLGRGLAAGAAAAAATAAGISASLAGAAATASASLNSRNTSGSALTTQSSSLTPRTTRSRDFTNSRSLDSRPGNVSITVNEAERMDPEQLARATSWQFRKVMAGGVA